MSQASSSSVSSPQDSQGSGVAVPDLESIAPVLLGHDIIPDELLASRKSALLLMDGIRAYRIPLKSMRHRLPQTFYTLMLLMYFPTELEMQDVEVINKILTCHLPNAMEEIAGYLFVDKNNKFKESVSHLSYLFDFLDFHLDNFITMMKLSPSNLKVLQSIIVILVEHHILRIGNILISDAYQNGQLVINKLKEKGLKEYWVVKNLDDSYQNKSIHMRHTDAYKFDLIVRLLQAISIAPVDVDLDSDSSSSSSITTTQLPDFKSLEKRIGDMVHGILANERKEHIEFIHKNSCEVRESLHKFLIDSCPTIMHCVLQVPHAWYYLLGESLRRAPNIKTVEHLVVSSTSKAVLEDFARTYDFSCSLPQSMIDMVVKQDPELVKSMLQRWEEESKDSNLLDYVMRLQYTITMYLAGHCTITDCIEAIPNRDNWHNYSELNDMCDLMTRPGWDIDDAKTLYSEIRPYVLDSILATTVVSKYYDSPMFFPFQASNSEWRAFLAQDISPATENFLKVETIIQQMRNYLNPDSDYLLSDIVHSLKNIASNGSVTEIERYFQLEDARLVEKQSLLAKHIWLFLPHCTCEHVIRIFNSIPPKYRATLYTLRQLCEEDLNEFSNNARMAVKSIVETVRYECENDFGWQAVIDVLTSNKMDFLSDKTISQFLHAALPYTKEVDDIIINARYIYSAYPLTIMILRERGWYLGHLPRVSRERVHFNWKSLNFWGHLSQVVLVHNETKRLKTGNGDGVDAGGLTKDLYSRVGMELLDLFFEPLVGYQMIREGVSIHECRYIGRFLARSVLIDCVPPNMDLHPAIIFMICLKTLNGMEDQMIRMFFAPKEYPDWISVATANMPNPKNLPLAEYIPETIASLYPDQVSQIHHIVLGFWDLEKSIIPCDRDEKRIFYTPMFIWNAIRNPVVDVDALMRLVRIVKGAVVGETVVEDYKQAFTQALRSVTQTRFVILCRMWCGSSRPTTKLDADLFNRDGHYLIGRSCLDTLEVPHKPYHNLDELTSRLKELIEYTTDQQQMYEQAGLAFQMD